MRVEPLYERLQVKSSGMTRPYVYCRAAASLRIASPVAVHAKLRDLLERVTDTLGPHHFLAFPGTTLTPSMRARFPTGRWTELSYLTWRGAERPQQRPMPLPHATLAALLAELEARGPVRADMEYAFLLRDPLTLRTLPYAAADLVEPSAALSTVSFVTHQSGANELTIELRFPYAELTGEIVRITDAFEAAVGIKFKPKQWWHVTAPTPTARGRQQKFVFYRAGWVDRAPDDDAIMQQIIAAPDDDGPRQIYADLLLSRDDPRGTFINAQCELARGSLDAVRRRQLAALARKLLREHGNWGRLPHNVNAVFRRGFVEAVRVRDPQTLMLHVDKLPVTAQLVRGIVIDAPLALHSVTPLVTVGLQLGAIEYMLEPGPRACERFVRSAAAGTVRRLTLRCEYAVTLTELLDACDDPAALPALESLTLSGAALTDERCAALATSPVGQRLKHLVVTKPRQ